MSVRDSCQEKNAIGYVNSAYVEDKYDDTVEDQFPDSFKRNKQNYVKPVPFFSLFQYSTTCERLCISLAVFLAVFSGCIPPLINVLYGEFSNLMIDRQFPTDAPSTKTVILEWFGGGRILQNASLEERHKAMEEDSVAWGLSCGLLSLIQLLSSTLSVFLLCWTAARQISRIKILFFKSIVCKDMTWFDTRADGNFASQSSDNMRRLEAGIGGVIGIVGYLMTIFVFGVVIALAYGWKLAFAILSTIPISLGTSFVVAKIERKLAAKEMAAYVKAGEVAEEVFTHIRTVNAFEGEEKEVQRYSIILEASKKSGIRRGIATGFSSGLLWLVIYSSYAVAFSYGIRLVQQSQELGDDKYTPASLLIIFFGILTGLTNMVFASSHLETFSVACAAAASVFEVINTRSNISPCLDEGKLGVQCYGEIEFRNVYFQYPSRPSIQILEGLNLKIRAGETVAIVGGSGTGKSTILQLIQRLYDPSKGEIFLDGQDLKSLKVSWLRKQMGVVGQEPLLFSTTILENIRYGHPSATFDDVIKAAKQANAHDFIMKLAENYETMVGQKGSTLSGGQKQRIAIARALVRNPKILLLDEATSALDSTNQRIVQAALDKAAKGRTTLIVTHRLSTIANADRIIVLANGVVAEEGTHSDLVTAKGLYFNLLQSQEANVHVSENIKEETKISQSNEEINYEEPSFSSVGPHNRFSLLPSYSAPKVVAVHQYESADVSFSDIIKWSKPEWAWLAVAALTSLIAGAALPVVCVLFGSLFGLFSVENLFKVYGEVDLYAIFLVVVGIIAGICVFLQVFCFAVAKMRLTTRLRIRAFECMIHQDIAWFDNENNKVGALCLRLSQDVSGLQGIFGNSIGVVLQAVSTMVIAIVLSIFYDWKLTLVTLATIPFIFTGVYIESIFSRSLIASENNASENASKIAVEVISNIKAVASLGKEAFFIQKYSLAVREGRKNDIKKSFLRAFAFSIGQTAPYFGYAVSLWYGGMLIVNEDLHYKYVIMVSELLIFGAWTLSQSVFFASSFSEAKSAARRLQYLFSRKPLITDGTNFTSPDLTKEGSIKYSKVTFAYPTRPRVIVLQNFSMFIKAGESIGIMGPSGSGKSTVIQLLQRFYSPNSGSISINDVNIENYKLSSLKKVIGLVSQEPVLFDRTIQENIAYGDNSRVVSISEITDAARKANIHSFIATLPLGYDTRLGSGGAQLSGGQKQRIAIARALVRNPQILLLDEATSALDPQSESVVQEALDNASSGRTTITIAHRLGAVRKSDIIYVMEKGVIQESGTHQQLMQLKGIYHGMHDGKDDKNEADTSEK